MISEPCQTSIRDSRAPWFLLASVFTVLIAISALGVCVVYPAYKKQDAIASVLRLRGHLDLLERGPAWFRVLVGKDRARGFDEVISVNVGSSDFDDSDMRYFDWLDVRDSLCIAGTRITDRGLVHLRRNVRLIELDLSDTVVTGVGMLHLHALANLRQLNICRTLVKDDQSPALAELTQLVELKACETAFGNNGLMQLEGLQNLECIQLDRTQITDVGLRHLRRSLRLRYLSIKGTHVTDDGLAFLKELKQLRGLNVSHTAVSEKGLWNLQSIVEIGGVDVFDTQVNENGEELSRLRHRLPFTTFSFKDNELLPTPIRSDSVIQ